MPKLLAHQVKAATRAEPKPFTLKDEATGTTIDVVLRRLNDLEHDRAIERADLLAPRYVTGGWFDDATKKIVEEPETVIAGDGSALPISKNALDMACRFCMAQVVDEEEERYEPLEFLDLCNSAEGIYGAAYLALAEVSVRPKPPTE